MSDPLFPDVDPREAGDGLDDAPARYETANRDQIELQPCDLEALLPPGHAARLVWRFVEGLVRPRSTICSRNRLPRCCSAGW